MNQNNDLKTDQRHRDQQQVGPLAVLAMTASRFIARLSKSGARSEIKPSFAIAYNI